MEAPVGPEGRVPATLDDRLAVLREEIRGVEPAVISRHLWYIIGGGAAGLVAYVLLAVLLRVLGLGAIPPGTGLGLVGVGSSLHWLFVARYRRRRRTELGEGVRALPAAEREAFLSSLLHDPDEGMREAAGWLADELGRPSEVIPAVPTSRGDEPTPAGEG